MDGDAMDANAPMTAEEEDAAAEAMGMGERPEIPEEIKANAPGEDAPPVNAAADSTAAEDAAPVDATTEDAAPMDAAAEDAAPVDAAAEDAALEDTTPVDAAAEDTTPVDAAAEDAALEDTTPVDAAAEDTAVEDAVEDGAAEAASPEAASSEDPVATSVEDAEGSTGEPEPDETAEDSTVLTPAPNGTVATESAGLDTGGGDEAEVEPGVTDDAPPEETQGAGAPKIEDVAAHMDLEGSAEEELAATKIQAIHRGKQDRRRLADTDGQPGEAASEELQTEATADAAQPDAARAEAKKNSVFAMLASSIGQKPGTPRNKYAERYNSAADSRIEVVKNPPPPAQPGMSAVVPASTTNAAEAAGATAAPVSRVAAAPVNRPAGALTAAAGTALTAAKPVGEGQLFRNLHLAELQALLVTMGLPSDGGKYELLGRLEDALEARAHSDGGPSVQKAEPRQRDQLGREMPAWQQQQIEEGGQAYSGKGIFSAMAQDRVQARPVLPDPQTVALASSSVGATKPQWPQSQPQPQRVEDRGDEAYAAAWRELEGNDDQALPTYAQEARHATSAAAATSSAGGTVRGASGGGFYGSTGVVPSPPVGPRPQDQRTPRQLQSTVGSTMDSDIGRSSATNLQDKFAAADKLVREDRLLSQNLDLLAELTDSYGSRTRPEDSTSQRDRHTDEDVAARGAEIDRGRRKSTRGHRNRTDDTPAMALRRRIRASSYNQGGEDWKDAFKQYDRDESGELDFDEFKRAIRRTAKIAPSQISDKELKKLFKLIDIDRGGSISADEFVAFLNGTGNFDEANEVRRTPTPDSAETKYYKEGPKGRRVDGRDQEYERPWERDAYQDLRAAPRPRRKVNVVAANARAAASRGGRASGAVPWQGRSGRGGGRGGRGSGRGSGGGTIQITPRGPGNVRQMARAEALAVLGL